MEIEGYNHPDTARSLSTMGVLLYTKGDYDEALVKLQKTVSIHESWLDSDHVVTAIQSFPEEHARNEECRDLVLIDRSIDRP